MNGIIENTGELVSTATQKQDELTSKQQQAQENTSPIQSQQTPDTNFMEMYEDNLKILEEGEIVKGEIIKIGKEYVYVDIGYKSEGQITINEFKDNSGDVNIKIGDIVDVLVERKDEDDGIVHLSKEKAEKIRVWDKIKEIYEKDGVIKGKIISRVKGGMSVDIGVPAFLPGSQIDLKPVKDFDALVGTEHNFKILKYNRRRNNIVLSRRAILEKERNALREKTLQKLKVGAVMEGKVKNITDYGLFIDLGGIDGLLHITDMSWGRVTHPSQMYRVGDKITVKVLSFDIENEKVALGLKQLTPDPWINADEKYPVGTKVKGKVVSLTDYGAFVELEEGVEGLIHVSEMSWTRKIKHPSQVVNVGDMMEVMVLNIDASKKRISLGLKQVEPNPWDIIEEKYPVGTIIEGRIKNITEFGLFIGIDEGIDGLVHISDISWTKRIKHPSEVYKKGQKVQAIVLNIDKENERFSLGIKQLMPDPWDRVEEKYSVGSRVTGTITNITDFGIFLELEEGIEGLIHISEIPRKKDTKLSSLYNIDDVIEAKVINVSKEQKKIGLSIKKLEESNEKEIFKNYLRSQKEATSNLGELLKEGLLKSQKKTFLNPSKDQD